MHPREMIAYDRIRLIGWLQQFMQKEIKQVQESIYERYCWIAVTLFIVILDRFTKTLVIQYLPLDQPIPVTPFFNLLFTYNAGAAFSFLQNAGGWQEWMFGVIAVCVSFFLIVWIMRIRAHHLWLKIALALVLGGTLGNLFDRVVFHHVIDFLDFYFQARHFATFNLADSAICVGATMLVIDVTNNH